MVYIIWKPAYCCHSSVESWEERKIQACDIITRNLDINPHPRDKVRRTVRLVNKACDLCHAKNHKYKDK